MIFGYRVLVLFVLHGATLGFNDLQDGDKTACISSQLIKYDLQDWLVRFALISPIGPAQNENPSGKQSDDS
jgi:hypothetical protein